MTIKRHNGFLNPNFGTLNYLKKLNDYYDVIKVSLILKTVWKEGRNCSNSNRYISGTNWKFCMRFSAV